MQITYYGHSCFLAEFHAYKLLFDPFISGNHLAHHIDIDSIKADYIFLSHAHGDHISDIDKIYNKNKATIITNFEIAEWLKKKGIDNVHGMNHGGKWKFEFGTVKTINAIHSSSLPDGSYGGNPLGFVVQTPDKTFYYSGDTALHQDMKLIPEEYTIDFAVLPIGGYFTMDVIDATKAAEFVQTKKIIGVHFDTFPYIRVDHEQAKNIAANKKKELLLVEIGKQINI